VASGENAGLGYGDSASIPLRRIPQPKKKWSLVIPNHVKDWGKWAASVRSEAQ